MKHLAIIPARSGSKGLKDKNIRVLQGKPLIYYTIKAAQESNMFDEIYVSTDSEKYSEIAQAYGASVPFLRSAENSRDSSTSWETVKEAIEQYKAIGKEFDTVALLQPTSPFRTAQDIVAGYKRFFDNEQAKGVIGVCEMEHSPLWSAPLGEQNSMCLFSNNYNKIRQELPLYYRINGALYIVETAELNRIDRLYDYSVGYIMPKERSVDIDDEWDFKLAEFIMNQKEKIF